MTTETIEVIRDPKKVPIAAPIVAAPVKAPMWKILLEDNKRIPPGGQFFGSNGVGYMLKAGVPASVPEVIINILNDAIMSEPVMDDDNQKIIGYTDRLRFPYRVLKQPT